MGLSPDTSSPVSAFARMRKCITALSAVIASITWAGPDAGVRAPQPPSCTGPEFRQFDFWLGTWDVTNPAGKPVGTNVITSELKGCVLHEHWSGMGGNHGESFNLYDATTKKWHQTWVDDSGSLLLLDGALTGGAMILSNPTNRITYQVLPDRRVRQLWETTADGGKTWSVSFDGQYTKR